MPVTRTRTIQSTAAAICFTLMTLLQLLSLLRSLNTMNEPSPVSLLITLCLIAGSAVTAAALFLCRRDQLLLVGVCLLAACALLQFLMGFGSHFYSTYHYHFRLYSDSYSEYRFNLLCLLPFLAYYSSYVLLALQALVELSDQLSAHRELTRKLFFLPGALSAAALPLSLLTYLLLSFFSSGSWLYMGFFFSPSRLLAIPALLLCGQWLSYPNGRAKAEYDGTCGIAKLLVCSFFTLGIYNYIWIYRTTRYLDPVSAALEQEKRPVRKTLLLVLACLFIPFFAIVYLYVWIVRNESAARPGHQVTACLFVPFYTFYWIYKNARRLDALSRERGFRRMLTIPCMAFGFFFPIVAFLLMQDRINALILGLEEDPFTLPAAPEAPPAAPCENPDQLPPL